MKFIHYSTPVLCRNSEPQFTISVLTECTRADYECEAGEKPHLLWWQPSQSYLSLFLLHTQQRQHKRLPVPRCRQRPPLSAYLGQAALSTGHLRGCGNCLVRPLSHINTSRALLHNDTSLLVSGCDYCLVKL